MLNELLSLSLSVAWKLSQLKWLFDDFHLLIGNSFGRKRFIFSSNYNKIHWVNAIASKYLKDEQFESHTVCECVCMCVGCYFNDGIDNHKQMPHNWYQMLFQAHHTHKMSYNVNKVESLFSYNQRKKNSAAVNKMKMSS